jgi:chitinase
MTTFDYDGIDLDMEPIPDGDDFEAFVPALKAAMIEANPDALLAIAALGCSPAIAAVEESFDQINVMTYDMSGNWGGWVVWHNSPVLDGGLRFPSTNQLVPSADGDVEDCIADGVPKEKIGIGIDFYGYYWNGVTEPGQDADSNVTSVRDNVAYTEIAEDYGLTENTDDCTGCVRKWDDNAKAAYLSIGTLGEPGSRFVSYDNEQTAEEKIAYIRSKGIGGLIIWELGGAYFEDRPAGQKDPLLQAIGKALRAE